MKWLAAMALGALLNPSLALRDVDGVQRRPLEVARGHTNALFFITQDCPISNRYAHEIRRICDGYASRGVSCTLVYVDGSITDVAAKKHAQEYGHGDYPKIVDRRRQLVAATGATITPEAVVVGSNGAIAYRGRIDNGYAGLLRPRSVVTEHDLRDALDAVTAGKPAPRAEVPATGCYIPDLQALPHP
jgi:hypothetical protein